MRSKGRQKAQKVRRSNGRASILSSSPLQNNTSRASVNNRSPRKARGRKTIKSKLRAGNARKKGRVRVAGGVSTQLLVSTKSNSLKEQDSVQELCQPQQSLTNADDVPTTSAQAAKVAAKPIRSNNFVDHSGKKSSQNLRETILKRLSSSSNTSIASKYVTRKLLRSIKRRQQINQHHSANITPKNAGKDLRRKLNFAGNANAKKNKESNHISLLETTQPLNPRPTTTATLEDGEIVSEDEINKNTADQQIGEQDEDDDDCVCIEPYVELITIEDDMSCTRLAVKTPSKETTTLFQRRGPREIKNSLLTSTPRFKIKTSASSTTPGSPSYAAIAAGSVTTSTSTKNTFSNNDAVVFFEDVSRINWLETISSEDTFADYTKLTTLRGGPTKPHRRSHRLKNKSSETASDEVIVLDESTLKPYTPLLKSLKRKSSEMDDSVIFVSESNPNQLPTFIPLESNDVPNPIKITPLKTFTPKSKRPRNDLFTRSEKKQLTEYNDNAYNPNAGLEEKTAKRMVIIDGSNVAYNHALNKEFSVKGLKICLEYFEKMGHDVKAVVPQFRLNKYKSTEPEELNVLHRAGKIVFTPCKNLPGAKSSSYDDRFVLQLACELDAAVVSNDNYRDLINENSAFKKIIENRVIGYTWCNDIFILPKDPYGKWGPTLHTILNR